MNDLDRTRRVGVTVPASASITEIERHLSEAFGRPLTIRGVPMSLTSQLAELITTHWQVQRASIGDDNVLQFIDAFAETAAHVAVSALAPGGALAGTEPMLPWEAVPLTAELRTFDNAPRWIPPATERALQLAVDVGVARQAEGAAVLDDAAQFLDFIENGPSARANVARADDRPPRDTERS